MSIRRRIILGIVLLIGGGFYFPISLVVDDIELRYRESTEEPLVDASRVLAALAASSDINGNINLPLFRAGFDQVRSQVFSAQVFGLLKSQVDWHVYITDRTGVVIFDSNDGRDEGKDYSQWRDVHRTLRGDYGARTSPMENNADRRMMYIAAPILHQGDLIGVLSVGKPTYSADQFTEAAQNKFIIGGTFVCLALIVIGLLLSVWVTRPIIRLTDYARAVRDGKRLRRPRLGSSEMEELGVAFEQMRDALAGKRYVENYVQTLTHEIKSPLSAISGAVELLEEDLTPAQRQTFLRNIRQESGRIGRIVDNLLLLSSLETRKYINSKERIGVSNLLAELEKTLAPLLAVKNIELDIRGERDLTIRGEPNLIRQALLNIVQNAIDFSPAGGAIVVRVLRQTNGVCFAVLDQGPGIPDYARERVFERFYSLKRPSDGRKSSGLGLSLVKEIAVLHQGNITLTNRPDGGAEARLFFPSM
ncbi:two-component system sensor histidine kinase CreC [Methylomarinum sp. Ch1-1]|uniref:histidine kinase n=1 Tax=Methylomarinum roseum TaxID=3067653 RepID=A0AAU7NW95_9GAMM|nr:two-component system sensor histidine kinase CreC [Methylomarinum sp. Ch1-1]MDP4522713.1 two-component system sensor histidine kinase CreC [Methylomarinum sp. Ch1-1]